MAAEPALSIAPRARRGLDEGRDAGAVRTWQPALTPRFTLGRYALATKLYWVALASMAVCATAFGGMLHLVGTTGDAALLPHLLVSLLAFALAGGAATFCHQMRKGHRRIVAKYEHRPRHARR